MPEVFTTGTWRPKPGEEDAFVEAWADFAAWGSGMPGAGTLRLARSANDEGTFVSFGRWDSIESVRAWKSQPEFSERMARVRQHVDAFHPDELEVVATARSGAATNEARAGVT